MSQWRVTEVDGVPAVWDDVPGPFTGALLVRVGHVDETLARHGVTHMLEHLALHGLDHPGEHSNGRVDATSMLLHATGTPEDVAAFLARAAAQLAAPPVARLEDEKGILRAERARQGPATLGEMFAWRWGTLGYGLETTPEYGLARMTADDIVAWSRTYATRQNAVLWFTGPPPAGLRVALPDGERRLPPDPYASPLPDFPAHFASAADVVLAHGLVRRSTAGVALASVLRSRLVADLRVQRAAAYSPDTSYRPLTADVAALLALTDVVEGRAAEVSQRVVGILDELATVGGAPRPEEIDAHVTSVRQSAASPGAAGGMVMSTAWDLLHGGTPLTMDEVLDKLTRLTPEDVRAVAGELGETVLLQVPNGVPLPPWPAAPTSPAAPVRGRRFAAHDAAARLVIGDAGLTLMTESSTQTVRRVQVAALAQWEDGGRVLIGNDGVHVPLEPTVWRRGRRAVGLLDALVPASLTVPLGARPSDSIPRVPRWRRFRRPLGVAALGVVAIGALVALRELDAPWMTAPYAVLFGAGLVRVWRGKPADW